MYHLGCSGSKLKYDGKITKNDLNMIRNELRLSELEQDRESHVNMDENQFSSFK